MEKKTPIFTEKLSLSEESIHAFQPNYIPIFSFLLPLSYIIPSFVFLRTKTTHISFTGKIVKMCYPLGAYWEGDYKPVSTRRQLTVPPPATTHAVNAGSGLVGGGGGGGIVKVCLCSPTNHPGSFRCRHHHGEYQWINRQGNKAR